MKIIKKNTNCYCSKCDNGEAEYIISNNGSFKLFWANGDKDCEIGFCEDCARDLFNQLAEALNVNI